MARRTFGFFCVSGVLGLMMGAPGMAEGGPSFDCAKAGSEAEKLICADAELARLDRLVAERYGEALAAAGALDVGAEEARDTLKAMQRGWIKGRDECWKASDPRACVAEAYQRQEAELVATWMLEEPTKTAFWACGGSPANEIVTMFFGTEIPSLRFERGDSIDTGVLVPSASGAKYEGSFGRWIWIKGEEAIYREPDPDGTEYSCEVSGQR